MRRTAPFAALFLAGCACVSAVPPSERVQADFVCDDGRRFVATFDNADRTVTVLPPGGSALVMTQTVSGSGIRYRSGDQVFHAKGRNAMWISGGTSVVGCHETTRG